MKAEHGATQDQVSSANLELKLYGPSANEVQAVGNADDPSNPPHVWTGLCTSPVAVALRDKDNYVDLTGLARVRWETKVSGFHKVRPAIKLADGTWLVGDQADGSPLDWHDNEFSIAEVRWLKLKIDKVSLPAISWIIPISARWTKWDLRTCCPAAAMAPADGPMWLCLKSTASR